MKKIIYISLIFLILIGFSALYFIKNKNEVAIEIENTKNYENNPTEISDQNFDKGDDYTKSSITLNNGNKLVAEVLKTNMGSSDQMVSRIALYDKNGNFVDEYYRSFGAMRYLKILKLSSDESRLYFYNAPDGMGGYYAIYDIFALNLYELDLKSLNTKEIRLPDEILNVESIEDITDDGKIVSYRKGYAEEDFYRTKVALYFVWEERELELENYRNEGFTIAGGSKFVGTDKVIHKVAINNPDDEKARTIEYSIKDNSYKILSEE